jgi:hypothetical protein
MPAPNCTYCPEPPESGEDLCVYCALEHACRAMAAHPDPEVRRCKVCSAAIQYTEARVLRNAKNSKVGSTVTPFLCWVCARLHLSVQAEAQHATDTA